MKQSHGFGIFILIIFGVFLGFKGLDTAILVLTPLFLLWFAGWDEKRYRKFLRSKDREKLYTYRNSHY